MSTLALLQPRLVQRDPLALFLLFSFLLHLFLFLFFPVFRSAPLVPPEEQLTEVELLPPPVQAPPVIAKAEPPIKKEQETPPLKEEKPEAKLQERLPEQIVSPPDQANDQVPEKTRLLSDRNSSTKEQTVAVGNPAPSPPKQERSTAKEKPAPQKPPVQL